MTDVRLTAINPEDASVVPVACNARGELKLEEPIAPPSFDGNVDGALEGIRDRVVSKVAKHPKSGPSAKSR